MPRRTLVLALLGSTLFLILALVVKKRNAPTVVAAAPVAAVAEPEEDTSPSRDVDRVIARVGPVEFRLTRDLADVGGDHPVVDTHYSAFNTETKKTVSLLELVNEADLIDAILASPAVTAALTEDSGEAAPLKTARTLKDWEKALEPLSLRFGFSQECETQDLKRIDPTNFAIVDFDTTQNRMALHLALETASPECNGDFPRLRVDIPAPTSWRESLRKAKLGEQGFFAPPADRKVCDTCSEGEVASGFFVGA